MTLNRKWIIPTVIVLLALQSQGLAQSVADAARRERERREQLATSGKVITNANAETAPASTLGARTAQTATAAPSGECPVELKNEIEKLTGTLLTVAKTGGDERLYRAPVEQARAQRLLECSRVASKLLTGYYGDAGNRAKLEMEYEEEFRFVEGLLGPTDLEVLKLRLKTARDYNLQGMHDQARRHIEWLAGSSAVPRNMSREVAGELTGLGMLYDDPDGPRLSQSIQMFQQAVALYDRLNVGKNETGPDDFVFCIEQYINVLKKLGRDAEVKTLQARLRELDPGPYFEVPDSPKDLAAEKQAVRDLRIIQEAEFDYMASEKRYGTLQELIARNLLPASYSTPASGYTYEVQLEAGDFHVSAKPAGPVGRYSFRTNTIKGGGGTRFAGGPPGTPIDQVPPDIFFK